MKNLRKVTEGLKDSKRKTSDNAVAGLFPFQTEENLRSFERSCFNEKFREAMVGCSLLLAYISYIHMYLIQYLTQSCFLIYNNFKELRMSPQLYEA